MPWVKHSDPPCMSTKDERLSGTRARKIMRTLEKRLVEVQSAVQADPDIDEVFGCASRPDALLSIEANDLLSLACYGLRWTNGDIKHQVPFDAIMYRLGAERAYVMQAYAILVGLFLGYKMRRMHVDSILDIVRGWIEEAKNNESFAAY